MSIYKNEQRDAFTFWQRIRGFFGARCKSYVCPDGNCGPQVKCKLHLGHKERHTDGKLKWGLGDNWLWSTKW